MTLDVSPSDFLDIPSHAQLTTVVRNQFVNVTDQAFGAVGDGENDDTAAIQAAIDFVAELSGGIVFLPIGTFLITAPLVLDNGVRLIGSGWLPVNSLTGNTKLVVGAGWAGTAMITDQGATLQFGMEVKDISIYGQDLATNGILFHNDKYVGIESVFCQSFLGAGIYLKKDVGVSALGATVRRILLQGCVRATGLAGPVGAFTCEWTDCDLQYIEATTASTDYSEGGNRVGILLDQEGAGNFLRACIGEISETGILVRANAAKNRLSQCRADRNRGHGFVIESGGQLLVACHSFYNSQQTTNTYSGFKNSAQNVRFDTCVADATLLANKHKYGFEDSSTNETTRYVNCQSLGEATKFYEKTAAPTVGNWEVQSRSLTAVADDTTPSVANARFLYLPANTGATAITQLDDGVVGQVVTLTCTSNTNPSTIADSGNFILSAAWVPDNNDTLTLMFRGGGWSELSRSAN